MPAPTDPDTAALAPARSDHECFGCGDLNPIGLHLRFSRVAGGVRASFEPLPEHQGFHEMVHGGILCTVLDEAMAWATADAGIWAVTGEIVVRFRRPLHVGEATTVVARVTESRGRMTVATAELTRDDDQATIATASTKFVRVSENIEREWRSRYLEPTAS